MGPLAGSGYSPRMHKQVDEGASDSEEDSYENTHSSKGSRGPQSKVARSGIQKAKKEKDKPGAKK